MAKWWLVFNTSSEYTMFYYFLHLSLHLKFSNVNKNTIK